MSSVTSIQQDIENVQKIPIISTILDVVCQTTKMGFAAVARVTEDKWIACSVRDDIGFGLKPGGELVLETTICDEIRQSGNGVIINHVSEDPEFCNHHTPAMYGFQSYISLPIIRKDGTFFGTLCAIDPNPHNVKDQAIVDMFKLFSELISFHLDSVQELDNERSSNENLERKILERTIELESKNEELLKMNKDLQAFAYISSHDLQEPLRKIQLFVSVIAEKDLHNFSESGKDYFNRLNSAATRMRVLIDDLLVYSRTEMEEKKFEHSNLSAILNDVIADLKEEIQEHDTQISASQMCNCKVIPFQFRQLLYNLISNSIKFSDKNIQSKIIIRSQITEANTIDVESPEKKYCHIQISDNGIGFDQKHQHKIFELFQRLHDKSRYPGTGIGLAIVKKIVENHRGQISVSSELGKGTTFDIYLPID